MTNTILSKKIYHFIFIACISISLIACGNEKEEIKAGSICTIESGDGSYGVVKVLVINDHEAHVKIYKNKYDKRPSKIELNTLSMGSIEDKDGFGIGHIPLEREGFDDWKPINVGFEEVSKDDLIGYEMWKNQ